MKVGNRFYIKIKELCTRIKSKEDSTSVAKNTRMWENEKSVGVQNISSINNLATQENLRQVKTTITIIIC